MSSFSREWWVSRPPQHWWWRCLSLAALSALAGLLIAARLQGAKSLGERYHWAASQAILARDWSAADLWLKKLVQIESANQNLDYVSALVAEQRLETGRARQIMERLAQTRISEIRGPVGLWMAHDLLRKPEFLNREGMDLVRDLLIVARRGAETSQGAGMIEEVVSTAGFSPDAAKLLDELIPNIDDLRMQLADRYVSSGNSRPADGAAAAPLPAQGSVDHALRLAESHLLLKSWTDAELVLAKGLQEQDDARLRQALAELYVAMSVSLEEEGRVPLPECIRLVQRSYVLAPDNPLVLDRLAMFLKAGPKYPPLVQERLLKHLRRRLDEEPNSAAWQTALVLLEILQGTSEPKSDAIEILLRENPEARIQIARLYRQQNDLDHCHAHAQIAVDAFRERLGESAGTTRDRISLSEALVLLDRWKDAADSLLINGVAPHTPELRTALSNVYLDWANHTPDVAEQVNHLLSAWETTPREPTILIRLMELTRLPADLSGTVLTKLQQSLDKGKHVSLATLVLGSAAALREDYTSARSLLELAYEDLPDEPILLNNLAWVMIHGSVRDPKRALKLVNRAMILAPATPELRETRGHILFEMRRWSEAAVDLNAVLPMFPERGELHAMLAKAYEETGQPELAFRHRQLAIQAAAPSSVPRKSSEPDVEEPAEPDESEDELGES